MPVISATISSIARGAGAMDPNIATIAMIWIAVSASCGIMSLRGALTATFVLVVGGLALVGSVVVALVFRGQSGDREPA